ncbi:MAG TPA: hypothetical protein VK463_21285 [Desulfomonilaceae bacterium]|nr:hypothetical protein [Desulfomonilaceae bacterium]
MKSLVTKVIVTGMLLTLTIGAYGGCFRGWFLPKPLAAPVSLRDGSVRSGSGGRALFFVGGRTHYGGGYSPGK